jgi:hypothetical protein
MSTPASGLMGLPVELRDEIWSFVLTNSQTRRPYALRPGAEPDKYLPSLEVHSCVICNRISHNKPRYPIPLMTINKAIYADFQLFLYSKLEKIKFCNMDCAAKYLFTTQHWAPLLYAKRISVETSQWVSMDRTEALAVGEDVLEKAKSFRARIRKMTGEDVDIDWEVGLQSREHFGDGYFRRKRWEVSLIRKEI